MDRSNFSLGKFKLKEIDAIIATLILSSFVVILTFLILNNKIGQIKSRIKTLNGEYKKAYALYEKMNNSCAKKRYFNGNILLLVQKLQKDRDIKNKILSVSSTSDGNAIILKLRHLNLTQLLEVLRTLEGYSNIKIKQFTLRKSFSSRKLLDLDAMVAKAE